MNKERVAECIKSLCESKEVDVDFDDIEIKFMLSQQNIYRNQVVVHDTVEIRSKDDKTCFYLSGNVDDEVLAKCVLKGYLKEREIFLKRKVEEEYEKQHPILSLFKR